MYWCDFIILHYYTLNSLSLFWLAESVRWIFEINARDVITADYTIIMSKTLKVTGNHVMLDRGAWFLKVIMSSSRALCCLPSVKKQKDDFNFFSRYNKTIIRFGFCDIQNNQGQELFWISQKSHHIHVKNPLSGNMNTRLRMYKVLLFKCRCHLCKGSMVQCCVF